MALAGPARGLSTLSDGGGAGLQSVRRVGAGDAGSPRPSAGVINDKAMTPASTDLMPTKL